MFQIAPDEFALEFFKQEGITRQHCPKCKSHYWARPGRENCGEIPCSPYTFLDNSPMKRKYSMEEMRREFLDYFKAAGHTVIRPYPIVARWRNDVYLVGASIMDFQPYVIEGTVPPPANPLVISQPSVRFTDIENVGPTAGRHLTVFEMGGAHAFNYPDREVYWKEECVQYHHKLLTEKLGVPSESISYKEHFWSGGGNAGPDLEGIVAGLEISTLVFMRYRVENEALLPMKIRTVDTGYGIERWTWMSQGSPTGFHAIYGRLLDELFDMTGVENDAELAKVLTLAAGVNDVTTRSGREASYGWIAE
ncbi:MAG TPA: alanine--tRNA ligase-related protein, partial [Candidatus Binatus sp.]|nr:alanine--tRNA ligase-related protein [Candidatus Binatus sp.]